MTQTIRTATRFALYHRNAQTTGQLHCCYCGCELDLSSATLDHVVARQNGGSNEATNLVVSCFACNRSKGTRPLAEFVRSIADREAVALTDRTAPSGCSDEEWYAGYRYYVEQLTRTVTARVRSERRRNLQRSVGRVLASMYHRSSKAA